MTTTFHFECGDAMDQALTNFARQAQAWKPFFGARVRVALALREGDDWKLWYCYTAFMPDVPENYEPLDVRTSSVRALREVLPFELAITRDRALMSVEETPGSFESNLWKADLGASNLSFEYEPLHPARFAGPARLPALTVHWFNYRYEPLTWTKELDQELQLADTPFDGFGDLAAAMSIPVGLEELNKRRLSEFILLPPVELLFDFAKQPHSQLKNGELTVVLKAHPAVTSEKLRLGVKAFRQRNVPERVTLDSSKIARGPDGYLRIEHTFSSPDVPVVQVFISLKGELVGKWWVRDFGNSFNDRMLLHRAVDTNEQLKGTFFDRPDHFEDKVLLLLTLMGLTALKYGKIQTDAPDILAISAARHVFSVECTTGDINSRGKLRRLSERTKQIGERLNKSSNPPIGVVPVIFTSLPREETTMHSDTAAAFQIAVVARENITSLLEVLDAPISPEALYAATLSLIPSKKPEAPQQGSLAL
jgi:hypothetical protein